MIILAQRWTLNVGSQPLAAHALEMLVLRKTESSCYRLQSMFYSQESVTAQDWSRPFHVWDRGVYAALPVFQADALAVLMSGWPDDQAQTSKQYLAQVEQVYQGMKTLLEGVAKWASASPAEK